MSPGVSAPLIGRDRELQLLVDLLGVARRGSLAVAPRRPRRHTQRCSGFRTACAHMGTRTSPTQGPTRLRRTRPNTARSTGRAITGSGSRTPSTRTGQRSCGRRQLAAPLVLGHAGDGPAAPHLAVPAGARPYWLSRPNVFSPSNQAAYLGIIGFSARSPHVTADSPRRQKHSTSSNPAWRSALSSASSGK